MELSTVSVIIPCYRQGHLLSTAIESVLGQTYKSIEIVTVNDGSDDNTDSIADSYADRIKYVSKRNGGLSSARNAGIRASSGQFLIFLDADDVLHPTAIESMIRCVNRHSGEMAIGNWVFFQDVPDYTRSADGCVVTGDLLRWLVYDNIAPVHACLCSRADVERAGGFDESLRSCEDWDLWAKLLYAGVRTHRVGKVVAHYRRYAGTMSSNLPVMLGCRTQVLLRLHRAIVGNADLFQKYGEDLFEAERGILRRLIIQGGATELRNEIDSALDVLMSKGVRKKRSVTRAVADRIFGYRLTESALMTYFRFAHRTEFESYRNSYK